MTAAGEGLEEMGGLKSGSGVWSNLKGKAGRGWREVPGAAVSKVYPLFYISLRRLHPGLSILLQ